MGLLQALKSLFAASSPGPAATSSASLAPPSAERNCALDAPFIHIARPALSAKPFACPSGQWIVACDDSDGMLRGGCRDQGNGRVLLIDYPSDTIALDLAQFERPTLAAAANNGTFIVHDCRFGGQMRGDVTIIDVSGHTLMHRSYSANVGNVAISPCGRFAAVRTLNAPSSHANLLEVFDVLQGVTLFSITPVTTWISDYQFKVDAGGQLLAVLIVCPQLGTFEYAPSGTFLSSKEFFDARLANADFSVAIPAARELLDGSANEECAHQALSVVDAAIRAGVRNRPDWAAIAYRVRGEAFEVLGRLDDAVEAYTAALSFNPKVGVQRRMAALKKRAQHSLTGFPNIVSKRAHL